MANGEESKTERQTWLTRQQPAHPQARKTLLHMTFTMPTVSTRGKLSHKGQRMQEVRSEPTLDPSLTNTGSSRAEILIGEIMLMYLVNIHWMPPAVNSCLPKTRSSWHVKTHTHTHTFDYRYGKCWERKIYETFKQSFKKTDLVRDIMEWFLEEISWMKFKQGLLYQNHPFQKLLSLYFRIMLGVKKGMRRGLGTPSPGRNNQSQINLCV